MALRQYLEQKQQQKLSPLQMQVIKLTELPMLELEDRIKQELEDNPALDEGHDDSEYDDLQDTQDEGSDITQEDLALGDYLNEEETPDYYLQSGNGTPTDRPDIPFSQSASLQESLMLQIGETNLIGNDAVIASYIVGSLDESGYLERPLNAISDDLLFQKNIEVNRDHIENILTVIQTFEPAGIAARNLQECLLLQLNRLAPSRSVELATLVIRKYFEEFSKRHFDKLMRQLSIDEEELKGIIQEITSLNPKPGNHWSDSLETTSNTIIPDFLIEVHNGELILSMNNKNIPELRVSKEYSNLLQGYASNKNSMNDDKKNAAMFVKQKLDSARWFIDAIRQRNETLIRTMQAIMELQYDFFLTGDEVNLKPMILKDVAERTGFDISTISRVNNSKYVQTNFAVYPLKYFFSEAMQTDSGEEISSREVKAILKECIENEEKRKPLTDDALSAILNEKGYLIARRTVAKYREQLNIPIARLRKEI